MTHEILPADIDLANKLRSAGYSDDEVVTALVHRGIDPAEAGQLVDDLRNERPIRTKLIKGLEANPRRRYRERKPETPSEPKVGIPTVPRPTAAPMERQSAGGRRPSPRRKRNRFQLERWIFVILLCLGAAFLALIIFTRGRFLSRGFWSDRLSTTAAARERSADAGSAPDTVAARGFHVSPEELALEFRRDGLGVGESTVTHDNALKVFSALLGAPTRAFTGKETGTTNYAFDPYGLVVCLGKNATNSSILLDCDAVGGATGTRDAFKGLLRVEDGEIIRAGTPSMKLAQIKKLGLNPAGLAGGILDGRFQNLKLGFLYLKSTNRLSQVEIDFQ